MQSGRETGKNRNLYSRRNSCRYKARIIATVTVSTVVSRDNIVYFVDAGASEFTAKGQETVEATQEQSKIPFRTRLTAKRPDGDSQTAVMIWKCTEAEVLTKRSVTSRQERTARL